MNSVPRGSANAAYAERTVAFPTERDIRLASGLLLFVYVASHLVNHALGLFSIDVAERGLAMGVAIWQSAPGTLLLYGAAAVHLTLAFAAIYRRRTLRMPPVDMLRILVGLGIPLLLIGHVASTRMAYELYGRAPDYHRVVWMLWTSNGEGRQLALLVPGWLHGCLGIHFAFGRRKLYQRLRPVLLAVAVLLPVLAGLGFLSMGKELATDPTFRALMGLTPAAAPGEALTLARLRDSLLGAYLCAIALVFAARAVRTFVEHRRGLLVDIAYPQGVVRVPRGWSVLEASRSHHIAHASLCGGRARCSTCRVRVVNGQAYCPAPASDERRTLARIGAAAGVRLACQLRPEGNIAVVPLVAPSGGSRTRPRIAEGGERNIALILVEWDRRARLTERFLPTDIVYVSRLFADAVTGAVSAGDGEHCEVGGDDILVLFGLDGDFASGCRNALATAARIERALDAVRARLVDEFGVIARFTIVVHAGHAAVGDIGPSDARRLIAVGAANDAAKLLRARAVELAAPFIVSARVMENARVPFAVKDLPQVEVSVDGESVVAYAMSSLQRVSTEEPA